MCIYKYTYVKCENIHVLRQAEREIERERDYLYYYISPADETDVHIGMYMKLIYI